MKFQPALPSKIKIRRGCIDSIKAAVPTTPSLVVAVGPTYNNHT